MNDTCTDAIELLDPFQPAGLRRLLQQYYEGRDQLRRGLCFLAAGRYDQSIKAFNAAARANPESLSLPTLLAAAFSGKGQFSAAADRLEKLVAREPANVLYRIRHALARWKDGKTDECIASLRQGIAHNLESAELHFQLATVLASINETEEAELRFTQALTIERRHAEALIGLAMCHGARGDPTEAVRYLRRAQAENPSDARTALLLSHALLAAGEDTPCPVRVVMPSPGDAEDDAALDELSTLLEAEPDFVEAFLALESADVNPEVFILLAATLDRALERSPEHADLHYHCGCVLSRLGRTDEAIAAIERAIGLRPQSAKALIQLAKLYRQGDRHADACERLEEAIRLGAEYADVYYLLGNVYRDDGQVERARQAYQHALGINPQYTEALRALESVDA
ncbi:MAG: tetratricopeptide repeat protein [bacterium]|nr:tetratricopeptide repeat protein [bacterium]